MKNVLLVLPIACALAGQAVAAPPGYFDLQPGVTLESGDTWSDSAGKRFRLFGVQSCIRGTTYTDRAGKQQDCGVASLALFAAMIKDTRPVCAPAANTGDLTYVVCYAAIGSDQLDLGTMMITSGYAFASLNQEGMPVIPSYAVAEQDARAKSAGLWQFNNVTHPAILLSKAANDRAKETNK